jgi:hypothetical protein
MTNTERDKAIWQALGHCWHDFTNDPYDIDYTKCRYCKQFVSSLPTEGQYNPDFSTHEHGTEAL